MGLNDEDAISLFVRIEELELVRDRLHYALNSIMVFVPPETRKIITGWQRGLDALACSIESGNKEGATMSYAQDVFDRVENPDLMLPWPPK